MKTCPWCAEEIQDAAIVCKHCGRDVPKSTVSAAAPPITTAPTTPAIQAKRNQRAGIGCAVILLLMLGSCFWILSPNNSPEAQRKRSEDSAKITVTVLCENAVKRRLRAPGSADFPFGNAMNVEALGNSRYRMRSYVDAQNAFGAKLRNNFVCVMEGSGDSPAGYKLIELSGLN